MDSYVSLSPIVKQQLFALMDVNGIGMVDYESFLEIMNLKSVSKPKVQVQDTFNWEEDIISLMKKYIQENGITVEEAFKAFDWDFDGKINKGDLKWVLINILKVD